MHLSRMQRRCDQCYFVNALNAGKSTNAPAPVRGLDHCTGAAGSGASSSADGLQVFAYIVIV